MIKAPCPRCRMNVIIADAKIIQAKRMARFYCSGKCPICGGKLLNVTLKKEEVKKYLKGEEK